jgi:transcription elongation GreA/GreB family factor
MEKMPHLKSGLLQHCHMLAREKVRLLEVEIASTQESTISEGKSTAGDKHETGRAMMHLEQEKLQRQLAEAQMLVAELERIDPTVIHSKAGLGALITTDRGVFLIATGLGKVEFEEVTYLVVSVKAPISGQFLGKTVGDEVRMNGVVYKIRSLE